MKNLTFTPELVSGSLILVHQQVKEISFHGNRYARKAARLKDEHYMGIALLGALLCYLTLLFYPT